MWLEGGCGAQGGEDQLAAGARGGGGGGGGAGQAEIRGKASSKSLLRWVALITRFLIILFENKDVNMRQCGCNAEKKYVEHGFVCLAGRCLKNFSQSLL